MSSSPPVNQSSFAAQQQQLPPREEPLQQQSRGGILLSNKPPPPPRKWLIDRITGQSKYGNRERPPCPCCWVPPPVGWCPRLLETNFLCKCCGFLGISSSEFARFWCMNMAFLLNLCALLLTIYSTLAISDDFIVLTKAAFQEMSFQRVGADAADAVLVFVGLRATALDNPTLTETQQVVYFDEFCALTEDGIERYLRSADCDNCNLVSLGMIVALMVSAVTFVPAFFSEQLRMYSGYDVNCVKCYLTFLGIVTCILNGGVIVSFWYGCGQSFFDGTVNYDEDGNVLSSNADEDDIAYQVAVETTWGYGLITLVCATGLKFIALVFNVCIPTPNVTRDRKEQEIYESIGMQQAAQAAKAVAGGSSIATSQHARDLDVGSMASSQQQSQSIRQSQQQQPRQSAVASRTSQSVASSRTSQSMAQQVSQSLAQSQQQSQTYPAGPSVTTSQYRSSVGGGDQSVDPSVAYPGGPSMAGSTANPYHNA